MLPEIHIIGDKSIGTYALCAMIGIFAACPIGIYFFKKDCNVANIVYMPILGYGNIGIFVMISNVVITYKDFAFIQT